MGSEAAGLPSDGSGHVERCATKLCVSAVPVVRPGEGRKSRGSKWGVAASVFQLAASACACGFLAQALVLR